MVSAVIFRLKIKITLRELILHQCLAQQGLTQGVGTVAMRDKEEYTCLRVQVEEGV